MRRKRIAVICNDEHTDSDEFLEWVSVLDEQLDGKVKYNVPDRRIETPYAILYFISNESHLTGCRETYSCEQDEKILAAAIGDRGV